MRLASTPTTATQADGMRLELQPVFNAPLLSGFVERVAAGGPHVYVRLRCVLRGGPDEAELAARLLLHVFDPTCSSAPLVFASAPLRTDGAGDGSVELALWMEDVPAALRGVTHGMRWEVLHNGEPAYRTANVAVTLNQGGR